MPVVWALTCSASAPMWPGWAPMVRAWVPTAVDLVSTATAFPRFRGCRLDSGGRGGRRSPGRGGPGTCGRSGARRVGERGSSGLARHLVGAAELGRRGFGGYAAARSRRQRHARWVGRGPICGIRRRCFEAAVGRHGRARVRRCGSADRVPLLADSAFAGRRVARPDKRRGRTPIGVRPRSGGCGVRPSWTRRRCRCWPCCCRRSAPSGRGSWPARRSPGSCDPTG